MNRNLHNNQASVNVEIYRTAVTIPNALLLLGIEVNGSGFIYSLEHEEKTPSVKVYDDHLYDFSTGTYYDLIALVMKVRGVGFWAALEWIADHAGLPRPQRSPEAEKQYQEALERSEILEAVFRDGQPEPALNYLIEERSLNREVCEGQAVYFPEDYRPKDKAAATKGGLVTDKGHFLFAGYVVFAFRKFGRMVTWYGRFRGEAGNHNHHKPAGSQPVAFWNADNINKKEPVYVCESPVKALALKGAGFHNVIALAGKGFSAEHARLLQRLGIEKVILVFDTDSNGSGQKGALDAAEKCFRLGLEASVVTLPLPDGAIKIDLDEFFHDHTANDFRQLQARDSFDCLLDTIPSAGTVQEKVKAVKPIIELVAAQGDELLDKGFLKQITRKCPDLTLPVLEKKLQEYRRTSRDHLPIGSEFLPDLYADAALKEHHIIYSQETFLVWDGGVYQPWDELEIRRLFQQLGRGLLRKGHIDDGVHSLKVKTHIRAEHVDKPGVLNLVNGYIDLMAEEADPLPHTPDLISTIQLPITFDPEATCPEFEKFLAAKVPDRILRLLVQEMAGYLLIPSSKYERGFVLVGPTRTGKSTLVHILTALVGARNRTSISLEHLGQKFLPIELAGKLANFSVETGVDQLVDDRIIKKIVSGDEITAEPKHQRAQTFRPYCRLVVACNDLPLTNDVSRAFFDRWIPIPFEEQTPKDEADGNLVNRIKANELPGVLLWALAGLDRLRKNDRFTASAITESQLEKWMRHVDPVKEFTHRFLRPEKDSFVALRKIFNAYNRWCDQTNRKAKFTDSNLKKRLENVGYVFKRKDTGYVLSGHWLAEDLEALEAEGM